MYYLFLHQPVMLNDGIGIAAAVFAVTCAQADSDRFVVDAHQIVRIVLMAKVRLESDDEFVDQFGDFLEKWLYICGFASASEARFAYYNIKHGYC